MTTPVIGDFIYFDDFENGGTNFRLKLLYVNTGTSNDEDVWIRYRHDNGQTFSTSTIKANQTTGLWSDYSTAGAPTVVYNAGSTDSDGNTVPSGKTRFFDEYDRVHTFTNPYSTSSGDTTEESVAVFTGGLSVDSNGDLAAFIAASSPSGNYWIVEGTTPRNGINHVILTATYQPASGWSTDNTSTWYLQDGYGNVLDTFKANKKVHCNFW